MTVAGDTSLQGLLTGEGESHDMSQVEAGHVPGHRIYDVCYKCGGCENKTETVCNSCMDGDEVDHPTQKDLLNNCKEDEVALKKQFLAIASLCGDADEYDNKNKLNFRDLCLGKKDEVDFVNTKINAEIDIDILKKVIERLETSAFNIAPVGGNKMARKDGRNRLYERLEGFERAKPGKISYNDFKGLAQRVEDGRRFSRVVSMDESAVNYFKIIENGKRIYKWPPPVFFPLLTLVQLVLFVVIQAKTGIAEALEFDTTKTVRQMWGYVTYCLVHVDPGHLVLNLSLQLIIGLGLEMTHGKLRVMALYAIGVLASSLAFFCFDEGILHGASGGLYCLIAASLSVTILNWKEDVAIFLPRFGKGKAPHAYGGHLARIIKLSSTVIFAILDFGYAAFRRYSHLDLGFSVIAHCFGFLTGLLLGFMILKNVKVERWEKRVKVCCLCLFLFLLGMAFGVNLSGSRRGVGTLSAPE